MKRLVIDVNPVVGYYVFGKWNGIGRSTYDLVMALAKKRETLPFELMLYSQNMHGVGAKNMQSGLPFRHLYLPHRKRVNDLVRILRLREAFTRYDLMHIPNNIENIAHPGKCIVTLHDALFMHIHEQGFEHKWMQEHVPAFMHKCRHIVTCSEYSKQDIVNTMQVDPDKIDVVYWGINKDLFHVVNKTHVADRLQKLGLTYSYFLSVSCNAQRKRTHNLVRAYIKFHRDGARHHLVLVWANPPEWLIEEVNSSAAREYIHFLSDISDDDLAVLYNGAAAAFTPSSFEGFGLPLIEAMACGCPVFCAENSSLTEIGGDAVQFVPEPIEESLADAMESIENNAIDLAPMRAKGLQRAAQFDWDKTADRMVDIYSKQLDSI